MHCLEECYLCTIPPRRRLVTEDERVCVYHNLENARVFEGHGTEPRCVDIEPEVCDGQETRFVIGDIQWGPRLWARFVS